GVPPRWPLGRDREVELLRPALPRARVPEHPRAGDVVLRALFQLGPREDAARLLPPVEPCPLRSPRVDDRRARPLGLGRATGPTAPYPDLPQRPPRPPTLAQASQKLIHRQIGAADNCPQCAAI